YSLPQTNAAGSVTIQPAAVTNAVNYDTALSATSKDYKNSSIFWLSKKNYTDLATTKETTMNVGNGNETFTRKGVSTFKLNYKGKEKIVTVFEVENASPN